MPDLSSPKAVAKWMKVGNFIFMFTNSPRDCKNCAGTARSVKNNVAMLMV